MSGTRLQDEAKLFESRKQDHIRIALDPRSQANDSVQSSQELNKSSKTGAGFDRIQLTHEALPDFNFQDIQISQTYFGQETSAPFFISSMTAGHRNGVEINRRLARAASEKKWMMGVGSQRKELTDSAASAEWKQIRKESPKAILLGNLGIAQVIQTPVSQIQKIVDSLEAKALFVHLNSLQEALQPEGTPNFAGSLSALENLVSKLPVPVIVKETGCGFSKTTCEKLKSVGVQFLDISGFGGTHWGRIEGYRSEPGSLYFEAAQTFKNWGISTVDSLVNALEVFSPTSVWASGGVRSGLDAAKLLAMGATAVGVAQPILEATVISEEKLLEKMAQFEFELKMAMFCTGISSLQKYQTTRVWTWI